jgi:hypothetical protein
MDRNFPKPSLEKYENKDLFHITSITENDPYVRFREHQQQT